MKRKKVKGDSIHFGNYPVKGYARVAWGSRGTIRKTRQLLQDETRRLLEEALEERSYGVVNSARLREG